MADPHYQKLARVLIHYSLAIKPGETLLIGAPPAARPLIAEVYRQTLRVGRILKC